MSLEEMTREELIDYIYELQSDVRNKMEIIKAYNKLLERYARKLEISCGDEELIVEFE